MEPTQGIQGYQAIQILNNDIYDSAGSNSSSSYVSSSGIKSVLLNAWNTVKSAVSGMLSSFGLHLSGQQGSDKPGREIVMDMSCRPLPPLPGMDAQFEGNIYESGDGNICNSVDVAKSECPGREIVIDMTRRPLPCSRYRVWMSSSARRFVAAITMKMLILKLKIIILKLKVIILKLKVIILKLKMLILKLMKTNHQRLMSLKIIVMKTRIFTGIQTM